MMKSTFTTIDEYILGFPLEIKKILRALAVTIVDAAPEASEKISWGMPTFILHGNLVHFAAQKKHVGFHPASSAIEAFKDELAEYHCSKGTVQFPYSQPLPLELISRMVKFRVEEQMKLAEAKKMPKLLNDKLYQFEAEIKKVPELDCAYIEFPYDVKKEFGQGRVKVSATFDGELYKGSLVRMKTPCHIIGIRKDIRMKIAKQAGDKVLVSIKERA